MHDLRAIMSPQDLLPWQRQLPEGKMHRHTGIAAGLFLLLFLALGMVTREAAACDTGCFHARVEYRGREPVRIVDNIQYYRWTYRVYGVNCINRALSHWILDLCSDQEHRISEISTESVDSSDLPDGTTTVYEPVFGKDPTTGHSGLKWNYKVGNAIDKNNEYDEFSFVASGNVTQVGWAAKGSTIVVCGITWGPGCCPLPTETVTWSTLKTLYR
jgi:hypothetical protein